MLSLISLCRQFERHQDYCRPVRPYALNCQMCDKITVQMSKGTYLIKDPRG